MTDISNSSQLSAWGWRPFFEQQIRSVDPNLIGRVIKEERDHLQVIDGNGQLAIGTISGNWKKRRDDIENPHIGDWIELERSTDSRSGTPICRILRRFERFSQIIRKAAGESERSQLLAANVDIAFLVNSCNNDFEVRRIERYLTLLDQSSVMPIIILNKCDLPEADDCKKLISERFPNINHIWTRADDPSSIFALRNYFTMGTTSVFLGSSGVGKSTLTNFLMNESKQLVQEIRNKDAKGRHTTTSRSLFLLPNKVGLIIDTPGLREVQLPENHSHLEDSFSEIHELAINCKFQDCKHLTEPNCAVKEAIKKGVVSEDKVRHFQKLQTEQKKSYAKKTKR